jgi:hypothetical protein
MLDVWDTGHAGTIFVAITQWRERYVHERSISLDV